MKKILSGKAARDAILEGMEAVYTPVAATLGPRGRSAIIHQGIDQRGWHSVPLSTRDGVTVARSIDLEDPVKDAGAQLLKSVAANTVHAAGDGTTTATILAYTLCKLGFAKIDEGANPVALRAEILEAEKRVQEELTKMSRPVHGARIEQVATISANNDPILGAIIADAVRQAGRGGVVTVEEGTEAESSLTFTTGMRFESGWKTELFVSDHQSQTFQARDCQVAIFARKLGQLTRGMQAWLIEQIKNAQPLLIIAEDIEGDMLAVLVANRTQKAAPWCAVRMAPGMSRQHLEDIAAVVGAKVLAEETGLSEDNVPAGATGRAKAVRVGRIGTTITGYGSSPVLEARIASLRAQIEGSKDDLMELDRLQERLAKLTGGVSIVKVGFSSDVELRDKKARVEDAIHATRASLERGILPGGGWSLERATWYLNCSDPSSGSSLMRLACAEPHRQIIRNAGEEFLDVIAKLSESRAFPTDRYVPEVAKRLDEEDRQWGWNALTGECGNMLEMGIIDPTKVTSSALANAASLAAVLMVTETLIVDILEAK